MTQSSSAWVRASARRSKALTLRRIISDRIDVSRVAGRNRTSAPPRRSERGLGRSYAGEAVEHDEVTAAQARHEQRAA